LRFLSNTVAVLLQRDANQCAAHVWDGGRLLGRLSERWTWAAVRSAATMSTTNTTTVTRRFSTLHCYGFDPDKPIVLTTVGAKRLNSCQLGQ
jgi:hypothetical protein